MDASSIITQVSRDDEQLNNFPEKGKLCALRPLVHLLPLEITARTGFGLRPKSLYRRQCVQINDASGVFPLAKCTPDTCRGREDLRGARPARIVCSCPAPYLAVPGKPVKAI